MSTEFFDNWTNQLRKGVLELCVLNDIRSRKMYGYEILKKLARTKGLIIGEGTVYRILNKLRCRGLIEKFTQKSPDGPERKHYRLTTKGEDVVCQMNAYWHAISVTTDSITKGRKAGRS
ncbi:MAG: PadR family transcriptional regulator [Phycisphaerae bacterium]|nr:PadR family transcriptional regulator [Phycisphaerae bacterium]